MTRRSILWRAAAALFVILNLGGAVYAAVLGELLHAVGHLALIILGGGAAYLARRVSTWSSGQDLRPAEEADPQLEYLQQSVDALAVEIERIGEAQRFSDKLRAERV